MAPGAQSGRMRTAGAASPHRQNHGAQNQMGVTTMGKRQEIAIGIALQTQVLKTCPIHNQLYRDEEAADDENMARAFAVAIELVRQHKPYAEEFHHNAHELTDLLSDTIGAAPVCCPDCVPHRYSLKEEAGEPASAGGLNL
jgi:hypothetical protein